MYYDRPIAFPQNLENYITYWIIYNSKTNITLIKRSIIVNFQSWIDCIQLKQLQKNFLNNRIYFFERNKIEKNLRILLRSLLDQDKIQIVEVSNSNVSLIEPVLLLIAIERTKLKDKALTSSLNVILFISMLLPIHKSDF